MGFLNNLLGKEARKIINGVVDSVVDNVTDSIKESLGTVEAQSSNSSGTAASASGTAQTSAAASGDAKGSAYNGTVSSSRTQQAAYKKRKASGQEGIAGDDADCEFDFSVIRSRIEAIVAEDWPSYELRRDIPAAEVGGGTKDQGFDYGLYLNGQPKLMIMLLNQYQHHNKCVQNSHRACRERGIGSFHLMNHLPNRKTYIAERMKECMPN